MTQHLPVTVLSGFLRAQLDATLLTEDEWRAGPRTHARLPDPLPAWQK